MLAQAEKLAQAWRISLLLGSAGFAAADFSQAPLMVSYFSLLLPDGDVALRAWRRQVRHCLPLPCFYGRTLSRTVPACCTGPPC
jgi:hypothetical protein